MKLFAELKASFNAWMILALVAMLTLSFAVLAQDGSVDTGAAIGQLISAFKSGSIAVILAAVVQVLKTPLLNTLLNKNPKTIPTLVMLLGFVAEVVTKWSESKDVWSLLAGSVIPGLFNGGLAIGVYEWIKSLGKEKKA